MAVTGERTGVEGASIPYLIVWDGTGDRPPEYETHIYGNPVQASITSERKGIDGVSVPYLIAIDAEGNEVG